MANKSGTNVAAMVTTFSDTDTYPTADADEILGGHHTTDTLADMYTIPISRCKVGTKCYVSTINLTYVLVSIPAAPATVTSASNWKEDVPSADNITVQNSATTLNQALTALDASVASKQAVFCVSPAMTGPDIMEPVIPFNANLVAINAAVQTEDTLIQDITFNIEVCSNGVWGKLASSAITAANPSNSSSSTLSTPVAITSGNRLRINITSIQSNIKSLVVIAGLQLTN